ncbi:MAG: hypothetical protein ACFCUE_15845 [Candidatus Bathyarchaeia archaeon]|jgi:hypothetical protein
MNKLRINKLVVKGVKKDYEVTFKDNLNIIAGEISTGKTSILELIDYCFGKKDSPQYPELLKKGTTALLEIQIDSDVFTIQRQLFTPRLKAIIHFSEISNLTSDHKTIDVSPFQKTGEESISSFVLSKIGLREIQLKEAPTKAKSDADYLSFRDVLWLCYLKRERVGGVDLLFEKQHMKQHKLVQVVDVIFNLHSEKTVALGKELNAIQSELIEKQRTENTLLKFVESQQIPPLKLLEEKKKSLLEESIASDSRLREIDKTISGSSQFTRDSQEKVVNLQKNLQAIRTKRRNDEKNLQRVSPLRAQYYEDIAKLEMLAQARELINPIALVLCPRCLSPIDEKDDIAICPLCGKPKDQTNNTAINVSKEVAAIRKKLCEIEIYIMHLQQEIESDNKRDKELAEELSKAGADLDTSIKNFVSPYISEREQLVVITSVNENELKHVETLIKLRKDIEVVTEAIIRLKIKEKEIEDTLAEERTKAMTRTELISSLSSTFNNQLATVNFPKLSDARIDEKLVPYVRGLRYNLLSSEGAINLISICWFTTIFSESMSRELNHPGFLIFDSIQSGIGMGKQAKEIEAEFKDEKIIAGLYKLLTDVSTMTNFSQVIVVDNHPPDYMSKDVIVRYSRDPLKAPYGFIDDETV